MVYASFLVELFGLFVEHVEHGHEVVVGFGLPLTRRCVRGDGKLTDQPGS
jgi:hypothetical protein